MKKVLCWLMILFIGVGCQEEEKAQIIEEPQEEMKEVKMAALNVCGDTENADILLLCADGSYILCDAENHEGYSVLYMNDSINNDFENGLTVFLDENGIPVMASSSDGQFVFKNVTGDSFDFAFINKQNEITYYNDIKFDFQRQSRSMFTTRSIFDPWIDSWKTLTSGGWDEHNKKAIVPFLCKIVSFAITAGDAVWGTGQIGLAQTILSEFYKSGYYKNEWLDDLFFGTGVTSLSLSGIDLKNLLNNGNVVFTPNKFGLSYLAYLLNEYGDNQLEKLGQIDEWVGPHFDTEEWRISLSTNLLECYPDDDWYLVDVSSKAAWDIDETQIDHNWCEVKKLDVQVAVHVKPNESENDRTCNLVIYAKNSSEIAPVSLTIKQSGIVFELSEEKLSFTQDGGSKGVYITTNENIKSWDVTSYPSWCKIEKGNYSFFVDVDENEEETRNGIITVTALSKGGISVDRYLNVEQIVIPLCPDNNHPHAIDLGLPSGTKWACCNVGASSPEGYGGYYAWGEVEERNNYRPSTYRFSIEDPDGCWGDSNGKAYRYAPPLSDIGETQYDVSHVKWGNKWRMPTSSDCFELIHNCSSKYVTVNGISGLRFTGANGKSIFCPISGHYWLTEIRQRGDFAYYWTSTLISDGRCDETAYSLVFDDDVIYVHRLGLPGGCSVRPIIK